MSNPFDWAEGESKRYALPSYNWQYGDEFVGGQPPAHWFFQHPPSPIQPPDPGADLTPECQGCWEAHMEKVSQIRALDREWSMLVLQRRATFDDSALVARGVELLHQIETLMDEQEETRLAWANCWVSCLPATLELSRQLEACHSERLALLEPQASEAERQALTLRSQCNGVKGDLARQVEIQKQLRRQMGEQVPTDEEERLAAQRLRYVTTGQVNSIGVGVVYDGG